MKKRYKKAKPYWKKLLIAALATSAIAASSITLRNLPYFVGEKVVSVSDGDTFTITNNQPIRLYSINAPEIPYCMGIDAKKALESLILGKRVIIREPRYDRFGRVQALVYVEGKLVNEIMLRSGLAANLGDAKTESEPLRDAVKYARDNQLGIYSPKCLQLEPPDPNCRIKANVNVAKHRRDYYLPDCPDVYKTIVQKHEGDAWFCTEKEAKDAGFTLAETCKK